MTNYEIFIDGKSSGQMVANSPSEEEAKRVWYHFNPEVDITLKEIKKDVPKMFSNCIMSK